MATVTENSEGYLELSSGGLVVIPLRKSGETSEGLKWFSYKVNSATPTTRVEWRGAYAILPDHVARHLVKNGWARKATADDVKPKSPNTATQRPASPVPAVPAPATPVTKDTDSAPETSNATPVPPPAEQTPATEAPAPVAEKTEEASKTADAVKPKASDKPASKTTTKG